MTTDGIHDNVMKFKPPLVFDKHDADYLVESFVECLEALLPPTNGHTLYSNGH